MALSRTPNLRRLNRAPKGGYRARSHGPNGMAPELSGSPPAISGFPMEGQTLSVSTGVWVPDGSTFTYQWYRSDSPIGGATDDEYTLVNADVDEEISVIVTATNAFGSTPYEAEGGTVLAGAAPILVFPPIISGTFVENQTLSVNTGTWQAADSFSYQWLRDDVEIDGATSNTYELTEDDIGAQVDVVVTATNAFGSTPEEVEGDVVEEEPEVDPFWDNVDLLVKFDGTHGQPVVPVDLTGTHTSWETPGTPLYSNARAMPWATTSAHFDDATSQAVRTAIGSALAALGTGQWTVEYWVNPDEALSAPSLEVGEWGSNPCLWLGDSGASYFARMWTGEATIRWSNGPKTPSSGPYSLDNWHHVAASRDASNVLYIFIDGVRVNTGGEDQVDSGVFPDDDTEWITIGRDSSAFNFAAHTYIQEVRITRGVCRYNTNFTPPTTSFPEIGPS